MSKTIRFAMLFLPTLFLACVPAAEKNIARRYTDTVRRLDISPVYPPREEFQVGDLYFVSENKTDPDDVIRIFIKALPEVRLATQKALDDRLVFNDTGFDKKDGKPVQDEVAFIQSDLTGGKLITRKADGATNSLPIATFPSIEADAGSTLNSGLAAPLVALGLFAGTRTKVRLDFKDVRTLSTPYLEANTALQNQAGARQRAHCPETNLEFVALMAKGFLPTGLDGPKAIKERNNYYLLVTRTYLTRHIDYTYSNSRILALARRSLTGPEADGKATSFFQGANIAINDPSGKSAAADLAAIVATLNQQSSQASGTQYASFSAFGLTIKRVFQKPLTIGYEAAKTPIIFADPNTAQQSPPPADECSGLSTSPGTIVRSGKAGVLSNPNPSQLE